MKKEFIYQLSLHATKRGQNVHAFGSQGRLHSIFFLEPRAALVPFLAPTGALGETMSDLQRSSARS